ncbi:MAG: BrnA antitoxin family protein [Alphaproteobacteria bacterium]|nr:BrnA antitoxin family protein [Alphaproteobacteria bacterium]
MSKRYAKPLTVDELAKVKDEDIDFSEVPQLDDAFWNEARVIKPDRTQHVTLRIKKSVLDHFKAGGRGYQTRINTVLESYVRSRQRQGDGAA